MGAGINREPLTREVETGVDKQGRGKQHNTEISKLLNKTRTHSKQRPAGCAKYTANLTDLRGTETDRDNKAIYYIIQYIISNYCNIISIMSKPFIQPSH